MNCLTSSCTLKFNLISHCLAATTIQVARRSTFCSPSSASNSFQPKQFLLADEKFIRIVTLSSEFTKRISAFRKLCVVVRSNLLQLCKCMLQNCIARVIHYDRHRYYAGIAFFADAILSNRRIIPDTEL